MQSTKYFILSFPLSLSFKKERKSSMPQISNLCPVISTLHKVTMTILLYKILTLFCSVCMHTHTHIQTRTHTSTHTHACMHTHTNTCMHTLAHPDTHTLSSYLWAGISDVQVMQSDVLNDLFLLVDITFWKRDILLCFQIKLCRIAV